LTEEEEVRVKSYNEYLKKIYGDQKKAAKQDAEPRFVKPPLSPSPPAIVARHEDQQ
jgi:hypothetical protein